MRLIPEISICFHILNENFFVRKYFNIFQCKILFYLEKFIETLLKKWRIYLKKYKFLNEFLFKILLLDRHLLQDKIIIFSWNQYSNNASFKKYSNRKNIFSFNQPFDKSFILIHSTKLLVYFRKITRERVSFCYSKYYKIALSARGNIQFDIFLFYFISVLRIFLQFPYVLYRIMTIHMFQ